MRAFKKILKDTSGNVAMMFAIAAVPLLMGVGISVDMSRIYNYHTQLQNISDTTALAASLAYRSGGQKEMNEEGIELFDSHASSIEGLTYSALNIEKTQRETVTVSAKGSFEPIFPQLFGYPKLDFNVESEASLGSSQGMEITIAFDSTQSMTHDTRWNTAMTTMRRTLENIQNLSGEDNFYITLVPFSDRVNIGVSNDNWVQGSTPAGWEGCVEPRVETVGTFSYMPDDDRPTSDRFTASVPGTLFENQIRPWNPHEVGCANVEITGPTNNVDGIISALNSMTADGSGRFEVGLAWAWRTLSSNWRGQWGVPNYPAHNKQGNGTNDHQNQRQKKIIYVTDGNSHSSWFEMDNELSWDFNEGSIAQFETFVELCRKVKESGIEIYMLNIEGNPHAMPYLESCASSPDHYYLIDDASDISIAFEDIDRSLSAELRLLR